MSRIVYVNGRYVAYAQAAVHVEDRGFQFADAVYEVCEVYRGHLVDLPRHLARLGRSLGELSIRPPMSEAALALVMRRVVSRNRVSNGMVYLQVSRGAAPRDFVPPADIEPTLVCLARPLSRARQDAQAAKGIAVMTMPDIRWGRCDIKTVMLLPACLAKTAAHAEGAKEAWLVDAQGFVTEGAASNAWIVDEAGRLVTRRADNAILPGVTRATLLDAIDRLGLELVVRPFRPAEAQRAREAFITSATNTVMPVVSIDGVILGTGEPGPTTCRLRAIFRDYAHV
ncbi:MAG: D-amino-acid transaminase [Hyphomicrobiaceae bacterium]